MIAEIKKLKNGNTWDLVNITNIPSHKNNHKDISTSRHNILGGCWVYGIKCNSQGK